mmetsp:Transcript_9306/g.13913  ORF Transcript_9306/g.13913 Transcript_9306/m.13913 type:complete len:82 (+) Transcript_9306:902-1147(+)
MDGKDISSRYAACETRSNGPFADKITIILYHLASAFPFAIGNNIDERITTETEHGEMIIDDMWQLFVICVKDMYWLFCSTV